MFSQKDLLKLLLIYPIGLLVCFQSGDCRAQSFSSDKKQLFQQLDNLPDNPKLITYQNSLKINSKGGHLQGIQMSRYQRNEYVIMTGSSNSISYYTVLKTGHKKEVISVNKILDVPYKHAGGFQLSGNLMAIGVEDNELKTRSKVFVYSLVNPRLPPASPLKIIDRSGPARRATAGCVAIARTGKEVLLIVGDWDAAHLDFYMIPFAHLETEGREFDLYQTIDSKTADKSSWINEQWLSYQSINLMTDASEKLYLAAFASQGEEEVLDLFSVDRSGKSDFQITKIYSRHFASSGITRFRWGAGIFVDENGVLQILASGENINKECKIAVYQ